jgi:copper(I)-binding protein
MLLTIAALITAPTFAMSQEFKIGDLVVDHPAAKTTPASAMTGAGYLAITNNGDTSDSLIAVEADFPRVMIHDTKVEGDVASMFHIEAAEIASGETVTFAPGGKHIMFMGLDGDPFEEGETVNATLVFEKSGRLDIVFNVETLEQIVESLGKGAATIDMDHSAHDDSSN